jgi:predicted metal-dependent HD superfamily phosphohydrolase
MLFAGPHAVELLEHWTALGTELALPAGHLHAWATEGRRLIRSWSRWPRRYHDTNHLHACLRHFEQVRGQLRHPQAVALALWFHDAVYWPWRAGNEERSAQWAVRCMQSAGLDAALRDEVREHILATRHQALAASPAQGDTAWVLDIDLAILGQPEAVYQQFERHVRSEYCWVRWPRYVRGRTAVLAAFLQREPLYLTPWFRERLEKLAKDNLRHALDALAQGRVL